MTDTKTIENWIDALNAIWAFDDGRRHTVHTYRCEEFPESLNLGEGPAAISYPISVDPKYGAASSSIPTILIWKGASELHLTPDLNKTHLSYILPFFGKIVNAAKTNITLGGLVESFILEEADNLRLSELQYGGEAPHYGIVVTWTVKQNLSGQI